MNLVFCVIWCGCLWGWIQQVQQRTFFTPTKAMDSQVWLNPDAYTIDGDLLKFSGKWQEGRQSLLVYYHFKTRQEKENFKAQTKPLLVTLTGQISAIPGPTNENEFDFRRYMLGKNISNELQAAKLAYSQPEAKFQGPVTTLSNLLHVWRKKIIVTTEKFPQPLGWFIQVLVLGYQSEGFQDTMDNINQLGLLYLFTLSGMHVFYLITLIRWLLRQLGITKETTDLVLLLVLPLYGIIGGGSLGLLRSVAMSWLQICSSRFGLIKLSGVECWSIVLFLNLVIAPAAIFSLGAQLSYLLTLILLFDRRKSQLALGIKMTSFTIPLVLYQTFCWNIWTLPLSLLIGPIFDWFIFPVVLIGAFVGPLRSLCNAVLCYVQQFFGWGARLPGTIIYGKPSRLLVILMLALLLTCLVSNKRRQVGVLLGVTVLAGYCLIRFPMNNEVTYFDIGQGDCSLIRTKFAREVYLIDTGGRLSFNKEHWQDRHAKTNGESVVVNYLHSKGITRIDRMYLTHQDTDHVGNFPSISQKIAVKKLIVPAGMEKFASFKRRLALSGIDTQNVVPVTDHFVPSSARGSIQILHPFAAGQGKNEDSLVLLYQLQGLSFLFTGDLDKQNELMVMQKYPSLHADVMKTGHHGSNTASDPRFIAQMRPKLAIISAGRNNRYGHPAAETLATLARLRVPYLLTARDGMIKLIVRRSGQVTVEKYYHANQQ
ncbi:DNA internalization-related competence protein ComEC/Rec2 [Ligilactobacillus salitolerans]|uniref:DNA internalization-related competence protein ComEC/Rec2 n=1 Tax=Ligilactobacillus salitolerans TaxID=1808352 RepID=UPI0013157359|nr:DNA internalization-related competence protein ComEC/Rec2 [Ligilactobacillus salitolerans]